MKHWTLYLIVFVFCCACDSRQMLIPPKLIWKSNPLSNLQLESIYPIFFENKVIISQAYLNKSPELLALSLLDGSVIWKYSTDLDSINAFYYNLKPYVFDSVLVLPGNASLLAVNINTGKKIWSKKAVSSCEKFLEGHGKYVFQSCQNTNNDAFICRINCLTGSCDTIYKEKTPMGYKKVIRSPMLIHENGHIKFLVLCKTEQEVATRLTTSAIMYLDAMNWQVKKIDTVTQREKDGISFTRQPQIDSISNNLYFILNEHLVCYNLPTLSILWKIILPRDMLTSDISYSKNSIYFPAEDGYLYCISKKNGSIEWKCKISGTPSRGYLIGKYYNIIGGGNGKWYIIDTEYGRIASEISSPNAISYQDIYWRRYFTVSPNHSLALATDGKEYFLYSFD